MEEEVKGTKEDKLPIKINFACPQCKNMLPDYAILCPDCGADLSSIETRTPEQLAKSVNRKEQSVFYYISPVKLVVMQFATCGIYSIFWFYKNWTYAAEHTNRNMHPLISTIFGTITYFSLMKEMAKAGAKRNVECNMPIPLLAIAYFLLALSGRADGPLLLLGILATPFILLPTQLYVNKLNVNSPTPINSKFSVLNWVFIVIGGALTLLGIVGILFPFPDK